MTHFTPKEVKLPSLQDLNDMNAHDRVTLLILRCMCSSDLAFTYMLYDKSTILDIAKKAIEARVLMKEPNDGGWSLSPEEGTEYDGYVTQLLQYYDQEVARAAG